MEARRPIWRAVSAGLGAALLGLALLRTCPALALEGFGRGAACIAKVFLGVPLTRVAEGWLLATPGTPVVVTAACSATDYFVLVAALVGWRIARRGRSIPHAVLLGVAAAVPLTLAINGARVVAVTQAHRWVGPLLPASWDAFLHLLTGVLVFLPSLVALNLYLESHERPRRLTR